MEIATPEQMRAWSRSERAAGRTVGLVPTMGYFHEGHLRLIDRARERTDTVVASVFVNPLQFGPSEDFGRYPRDPERDRAAALTRGTDCLFVPTESAMYPTRSVVRVVPGPLGNHLCGPRRPGHFEGVLTIVMKLFHIVEPDVAVFGRKDVQQAIVIRRMATDLNIPTEIDMAPTVREADGLAMSSRNAGLSPEERQAAPVLPRGLDAAHEAFESGIRNAGKLIDDALEVIRSEPQIELEYIEAVDPISLAPVTTATAQTILALAVHLGNTRLIDNIVLGDGTALDVRVSA